MNRKFKINQNDTISIIGGSGFVGRYVVQTLAETKAKIRIITSSLKRDTREIEVCGYPGQITFYQADIANFNEIDKAIAESTHVINLVGILKETRNHTFGKIHITGAANVAKACHNNKVKRLIHISALVDSKNTSRYAVTKSQGEHEVFIAFPKAAVVRPSVICGKEDNFINMFIKMAKYSPFLPIFGTGKNKLQPMYIGDLAQFIKTILEEDAKKVEGKKFSVAGIKQYTMKEVLKLILKAINKKRMLLYLPFWFAKCQAMILEKMPGKVLTQDQVELCKYDSVIPSGQKNAMTEFGLKNSTFEAILHKIVSKQ